MQKRLFHVNITRQCQLSCSHCYIDQDVRDYKSHMSIETMSEIAKGIKNQYADVHIIGGEPTLVPLEMHQEYLTILNTLPHADVSLITALQSNRALKIAMLYKNVITSYDPIARFQVNYNKWHHKINKLREQGKNVHVCVSVSKSVIEYGITKTLNELYFEYGFKQIHLAAMVPTSNAIEETPDPLETSYAFIESSKWVQNLREDNHEVFCTPYDGLLMGMSNYDGLRCPAGEECANIEPSGKVYACVGKGGESKDVLNLEHNFSVISELQSTEYAKEVMVHNRPRIECLGCEFWETCKGGCRILANTEIAQQSSECAGFKTFLHFMKEQVTVSA